jgi:ubiquinone/menaquinone biosynthesis C-methylase UbiE
LVTSLVVPKDGRQSGPQLEWTGERYVTSVGGEIEFEHTHRYLFAMSFAEGATVLDIASGEGYGSALLGSVARRVVGIDIDEHSVAHAKSKYKIDNLSFIRGDCATIPLSPESIDLVVSFETLEHIIDHTKFFNEISRILKPSGVLVISTPDRVPYNEMNGSPNPYHLKELDRAEFKLLLNRHFKSVQLLGQCYLEGSLIDPLKGGSSEDAEINSKKRWVRYIEEPIRARKRLARSIYLIGVASNQPLPKGPANLLTTTPSRQPRWQAIQQAQISEEATIQEVHQLRATLAAVEEQQRSLSEIVSDRDTAADTMRADIEQRAATEAVLRADIEQRAATEAVLRADIEQRAATEAVLRADIEQRAETLRGTLAIAEQNAREHATAAEVMRGEIASLQAQLTAAERGLRERTAAAEAMHGEITSLRFELAAARDIGRAALVSLRTPSAPILEAPRNAGWLTVVLRRLGFRSTYPMAVSPVIAGD